MVLKTHLEPFSEHFKGSTCMWDSQINFFSKSVYTDTC